MWQCGSPTARLERKDWVTCGTLARMDAGGDGKWRVECGWQCWVVLVRTRRDAAVVEGAVTHTWMERRDGRGETTREDVHGRRQGKVPNCTAEGEQSKVCDETLVYRVME